MILTIAAREWRSLFLSPLAWTVLAAQQGLMAWIFLLLVQDFQALQGRLAGVENAPGVTDLVAAPLFRIAAWSLLLITPLFFAVNNNSAPLVSSISPGFMEYIKAFGVGLVAVSFTYGGYQQTINFGSEVDKPNRNIPRGIFMGIFIIITLYLVINFAYVKVIGFEELKTSKNIAAIMASRIFGVNAERVLSVLLFLSVLAYINALLLSNPRVMVAMSEDKVLPAVFQQRNKRGALTLALSLFAGLAAVIVFWAKKFDTLLSFSIFLDCFGMILSAGSIFIIRKRTAHLNGTGIYSMKLYPLLPLIFIAAYSFVAISLLINETALSLKGLAVMAGFILIYFIVNAIFPKKTDS